MGSSPRSPAHWLDVTSAELGTSISTSAALFRGEGNRGSSLRWSQAGLCAASAFGRLEELRFVTGRGVLRVAGEVDLAHGVLEGSASGKVTSGKGPRGVVQRECVERGHELSGWRECSPRHPGDGAVRGPARVHDPQHRPGAIEDGLHVATTTPQWLVSAYAVVFGRILFLGGPLADVVGRARRYRADRAPAPASRYISIYIRLRRRWVQTEDRARHPRRGSGATMTIRFPPGSGRGRPRSSIATRSRWRGRHRTRRSPARRGRSSTAGHGRSTAATPPPIPPRPRAASNSP
jgi:hypothetical protein